MEEVGTTWIVAADAERARIFAEPLRAGALRELPDLEMSITAAEKGAGRGQRATVHSRTGVARHGAGDRSPQHEAERRFLQRIADRLAERARLGEFDRLVLMAPPHALGVLRQVLPHEVASRVELADPHERTEENAEALRLRLREARARA